MLTGSGEFYPNLASHSPPSFPIESRVKTETWIIGLTPFVFHMGRRVRKVASGGDFDGTFEYVYAGFNVIAIFRNNSRMGSYTWGLDKSGTLHGAGGVGGLLAVRGGAVSFPLYDGRGNVTGYLDGYGNVYRAYQFDAFGNTVGFNLNYGVQSMDFIGFASNFTDHESGLVDLGLRLYQPKHGRFISRDPIGEAGGENLYAHSWNNPVNSWDYLGLHPSENPHTHGGFPSTWVDPYDPSEDDHLLGHAGYGGSSYVPLQRNRRGNAGRTQKDQWSEEDCAELASQIAAFASEVLPMAKKALENGAAGASKITDGRVSFRVNATASAIGVGTGVLGFAEFLRTANSARSTIRNSVGVVLDNMGGRVIAPILSDSILSGAKVAGRYAGMVGIGFEVYNLSQANTAQQAVLSSANIGASTYALLSANPYAIAAVASYNTTDALARIVWLNPNQDRWANDLNDFNQGSLNISEGIYNDMQSEFTANCK